MLAVSVAGGRVEPAWGEVSQDALARGRAAWPTLVLGARGRELFLSHARGVAPTDLLAADLYLACACAEGREAALRAFEELHRPVILHQARTIRRDDTFAEDALQRVLERLFVGAASDQGVAQGAPRPKIETYAGRGSLRAWVALVAKRVCLDLVRRRDDAAALEGISEQLLAGAPAVERELFRRRYQAAFAGALRAAFAELDPRERALLRLAAIEGLAHARIAELFAVTQPTVTRWLADTRGRLADRTRALFVGAVGVEPKEVGDLVDSLISRVDVSLASLLAG